MANLLRSIISRFTLSDYVRQREASITNNPYAFATYPQMTTYRGRPIERVEDSYSGLAGYAYRGDSVVAACMRVRRDLFRQAKFCWRELGDSGPGKIFRNDDLNLLESPWPNGTTGELLTRMITDVDLCGNSFILNEGARLRWLRPDWVSIVLSDDPLKNADVDVIGYVYTPGGTDRPAGDQSEGVPYRPEEICHWSPEQDPMAFYRGMSWVSKALEEIHGDRAATTHKLAFFRNGATLGPIVRVPKETTLQQFKEFVQAAEEAHAGAANAYRTMYVGGGAEITLAAADFRQLDLKSVQGGMETRIAAVAGVHPVLVGLSEGLAGSSLNSGNFAAARRATAEMTLYALWQDVCGALQAFFEIPDNAELWIRDKDIPFLREERKDQAEITKTKILAIEAGMRAGYKPDPLVKAVDTDNLELLVGQHTGLFSVQMQPPQPDQGNPLGVSGGGAGGEPAAPIDFGALRADLDVDEDDIERALDELFDFDFDEIERRYGEGAGERVPGGFKGGGRFRKLSDQLVELLGKWAKGEGPDDPLDEFNREQLRRTAKELADKALAEGDRERAARLMPRRGASSDEIKLALYKDVRGSVRAERDKTEKPSAKFTLQGKSHYGKDVAVYKDADGRPRLFKTNDRNEQLGLVEKFDSLAELQSWAKDNGETRLAAWAGRERKKLPEVDMHTPAEVENLAKGLDMTVPASHVVVKAEGRRRIEAVLNDIDRMVADGGSNRALLVTLREHRAAGAPKAVVDELTQAVESGDKSRLRALSAGIRAQIAEKPAPAKAVRKAAKATPAAPDLTGANGLSSDPKIREVQVENRIRAAYQRLINDPDRLERQRARIVQETGLTPISGYGGLAGDSDWVGIADIRDELGGSVSRREIDDAFARMAREGDAVIVPQADQKVLLQRDRDSAVRIGGQEKHAIHLDDPSPRPLPGGAPGDGGVPVRKATQAATPAKPTAHAAALAKQIREQFVGPQEATPEQVDRAAGALDQLSVPQLRQLMEDMNLRPHTKGTRATRSELEYALLSDTIGFGRRRGDGGVATALDDIAHRAAAVQAATPAKRAPRAAKAAVSDFSGGYDARQAALRADHGGEPTMTRLEGGISSDVSLLTYPDGTRIVRKDYQREGQAPHLADRVRADAEELAPQVLDAVGAPAPAVTRVNDHTVDMEYVDGIQGGQSGVLKAPRTLTDSPTGRLIGLADAIMGLRDRNGGGWMKVDDGVVPIDNGSAFSGLGPDTAAYGNPFTSYLMSRDRWKQDLDVDRAQLIQIRQRLEALRPEFDRLGHQRQFRDMMARLDVIERNAAKPSVPSGTPAKAARKTTPTLPSGDDIQKVAGLKDLSPAEIVQGQTLTPAGRRALDALGPAGHPRIAAIPDTEGKIREAYRMLALPGGGHDSHVALLNVRKLIGEQVPRSDVDSALRRMFSMPDVRLSPQSYGRENYAERIPAAFVIGGQQNDLLHIDDPTLARPSQFSAIDMAQEIVNRRTGNGRDPMMSNLTDADLRAEINARVERDPIAARDVLSEVPDYFSVSSGTPAKKLTARELGNMSADDIAQAARQGRVTPRMAAKAIRDEADAKLHYGILSAGGVRGPGVSPEGQANRDRVQAEAARLRALADEIEALPSGTPAKKAGRAPEGFDPSQLEGLTIRQKRARLRAMGFSPEQVDELAPTAAMAKKTARRSLDLDEDDIERAEDLDDDELDENADDQSEEDDEPVDEMDLALEHYEPEDLERAAGHDVTPGHDRLHHYWVAGPGLARWVGSPKPWTTLLANLQEEVKDVPLETLKRWASKWFLQVFHFAAGSDLNRVTHGHPPRGHVVGPG